MGWRQPNSSGWPLVRDRLADGPVLNIHGIELDLCVVPGCVAGDVTLYGGSVNTRLASPGAHSRATASTDVESPHSTRWGPSSQQSPKTVTGVSGGVGTASSLVNPRPPAPDYS